MFKNGEGYPDPTFGGAYAKIRHEEKVKSKEDKLKAIIAANIPLIYICSPLKDNQHSSMEQNINNAKKYSKFAVFKDVMPLAVHTIFTQFLDDNIQKERELGMKLGIHLLMRCDELWCFGNLITEGMSREIEIAEKLNIPVKYFDSKCEEVAK